MCLYSRKAKFRAEDAIVMCLLISLCCRLPAAGEGAALLARLQFWALLNICELHWDSLQNAVKVIIGECIGSWTTVLSKFVTSCNTAFKGNKKYCQTAIHHLFKTERYLFFSPVPAGWFSKAEGSTCTEPSAGINPQLGNVELRIGVWSASLF